MTFCKDSNKCQSCEARPLCQALEDLVDALENIKPTPKPDDYIKKQTEEYISKLGFAIEPHAAEVLFKEMDVGAFQGMVIASLQTVSELYVSWESKCEELDKLKVQLEAQEAIAHG